jgi:glycosyltransferase involved in cell wall biosynthesis
MMSVTGRTLVLISNQAFSLVNFRGELISALVERGARVIALAPDHDDYSRSELTKIGAETLDYPLDRAGLNMLADWRSARALYGHLREIKPDFVLSYFIKPVIYGSIAARIAGVPRIFALVAGLGVVFTSADLAPGFRQRLLQYVGKLLYRIAFACCRNVFFQNDEDIADMIRHRILPEHKAVRLAGTGINLEKFSPAPPVLQPVTFLLMARLLRQKGIVEYASAAREVSRRGFDARFILLGGIDPNPDGLTESEVKAWVDEGILEWPGQVYDVQPYILEASVYVLPSYYREGVPRSTQEAMAMAKPIITTDNVGCRDTIIDGLTGIMVPVKDVQALAAAMENFITSPDLIVKMGAESRKLAERRFDVRSINDSIISVLESTDTVAKVGQ